MSDRQDSNPTLPLPLSDSQRHDLQAALLSIKWASELLEPADGSEPPCALIAHQLQDTYRCLAAFVQPFLDVHGNQNL